MNEDKPSHLKNLVAVLFWTLISYGLVQLFKMLIGSPNPQLESDIESAFEMVNTYLPNILSWAAVPALGGIAVLMGQRIKTSLLDESKKSYSDEMSIYSEETLPEPRPLQTGISLDDLVAIQSSDGELPESAYSTK